MTNALSVQVQADDTVAMAVSLATQNVQLVERLLGARTLRTGIDYGVIPGTGNKNAKPVLLLPGAQKLCAAFQMSPSFRVNDQLKEFGDTPFMYVEIECVLTHQITGVTIASAIGSCNTRETRYAFRWLYENEVLAAGLDPATLKKKSFKGKDGSSWYHTYQAPTPPSEVYSTFNTVLKIAQKRALVSAVYNATGAAEFFDPAIDLDEADVMYDSGDQQGTSSAPSSSAPRNDAQAQGGTAKTNYGDKPYIKYVGVVKQAVLATLYDNNPHELEASLKKMQDSGELPEDATVDEAIAIITKHRQDKAK